MAKAQMFVALLRGVNVGGKHRLPMAELTPLFSASGCSAVRTYIQSGNVVFSATATCARKVPRAVAEAIGARFGFEPVIVVRSAEELSGVIRANPFSAADAAGGRVHVGFLDRAAEGDAIALLDRDRSPGDRFEVKGREIYINVAGMGTTKLTGAYFDSALRVMSTFRNWRTVTALLAMMESV